MDDRKTSDDQKSDVVTNEVSTNEVRDNLSEVVNRVGYGKEQLLITRRGKPVAALVPVEVAKAYEEMKKEMSERKKSNHRVVPRVSDTVD